MRHQYARKTHQVVWRDLEPWVQQVYEDHRYRLEFRVVLPVPGDSIRPGVCMLARKYLGAGKWEEAQVDWRSFDDRDVGAVEAACLHMVSNYLLTLEADAERAERERQARLFG